VIGLSMRRPLSAIFLGGQVDLWQFIDVSSGVYIYSRPELASGYAVGDVAYGTSVPTQTVTRPVAFLSVSASVNLFASWLVSTVKAPSPP
jgi:hypothetical protein